MNEPNLFGRKLRAWRKAAGFSQLDLEQALGLRRRGFVNNRESGLVKAPVDPAICRKIAEVLDQPYDVVWDVACRSRLERLDPDTREFAIRKMLGNDTMDALCERLGRCPTVSEACLIRKLRVIKGRFGYDAAGLILSTLKGSMEAGGPRETAQMVRSIGRLVEQPRERLRALFALIGAAYRAGDGAKLQAMPLVDLEAELERRKNTKRNNDCTDTSAGWCPVHGDCTCDREYGHLDDIDCPLHSPVHSCHAEADDWPGTCRYCTSPKTENQEPKTADKRPS